MGLFNKSQIDKINNVAKKSKIVNHPVSNTKISSVNDELIRSSKAVEEYFKDSPAILITSKPQLHEYVTAAISAGIVGIDTETTGLDRNKDYIVGASLYYPGGVECYIALKHRVPVFETYYKNQISYEDLADELQRLVDSKTKLVFANANYDLYMIWKDLRVDLDPAFYYDVILAWRCLKEDELHNDLKHLYAKYVLKGKGDPKRFSDFFSPKLFPYSKPDVAKLYAANDAKITYDLYVWQFQYSNPNSEKCKQHHLENISTLIWDIEFPLVHICQTIERNGMYVDQDMGKVLQTKYHKLYDDELSKLKGMVDEVIEKNPQPMTSKKPPFTSGDDFNPKSTMHVQYLLYTLMGVPKVNGKMATGKEILNELDMPIATQIARVRSLSTNINTFVDKLPNSVSRDGKIHADFKQIGAACIVGDSIIPTSFGYTTMRDLCSATDYCCGQIIDDDELPSVYNCYQCKEKPDGVVKYEHVPIIKLTLDCGLTVSGTYNHPVMVSKYNKSNWLTLTNNYCAKLHTIWDDRYFKPLENIEIGDFLQIPVNYTISGSYQQTGLNVINNTKVGYNRANVKIPQIIDEDFAEFLGMYHADGSSFLREGTYTIALSNDDPDVYEHFDELSMKLFNMKTCRYDKQKENNEVETYINSIQLRDLDKLLITGKRNKRIPKAIWNSPQSVINAYIRGMTLDSTVYYDGQTHRAMLQLSIINEEDIRLVQQHLLSQGILSYIGYNVKGEKHRFLNLTFNADNYLLFRDNIGFIESKKYIDSDNCKKYKYDHRRIGNYMWLSVKNIEYGYDDVYDICVPSTHSFIANGVINHNTGRLSSSNPNLMNIPSRLSDIRHLFRADPKHIDKLVGKESGNSISFTVHNFAKLIDANGELKFVKDYAVGDSVIVNHDGISQSMTIKSIDSATDNQSILSFETN